MDADRRIRSTRRAEGMTLLELILALALSVLVLMAVGMAIDLHFRMLDVRRTNVEEAQLVRVIFRQMSGDLMGAMQNNPPDLTGLDAILGNAAGGAAAQAASALGAEGAVDAAAAGEDLSAMASDLLDPAMSGSTSSSMGATGVIGLFGTASELRVDVSRLPRVDEYEALMMASSGLDATDIPSDVKTVTYFLADEGAMVGSVPGGASLSAQPSTMGLGRGLMRSQVARAAEATAASSGYSMAYDNAQLVAEEVVGLQFAYFDGFEWYTDWDSEQMGGLPKAVEIVLVIQPTYALSDAALARAEMGEVVPEQTYRLVVHLPMSNLAPLPPEESLTGEVLP